MDTTRASEMRHGPLWRVAIALSMAVAGAIHVGQVQVHFEEWALAGFYFVTVGLLQIGLGIALAAVPSARLRAAALVVSVPTVLLWAASRSVGVPGGPHSGVPEAVDLAGVIATSLELVTITVLIAWGSVRMRRGLPLALRASMLTILFVTAGAAGATGSVSSECGAHAPSSGEAHSESRLGEEAHDDDPEHSDPNELLKDHAKHDVLDSFKRLEESRPKAPAGETEAC